MVFSFGLESILKQETVKRPDGKQHGITSKPGISNLDHLEATAGIVVSQEGHFSLQVLQESPIFFKCSYLSPLPSHHTKTKTADHIHFYMISF